MTGQHRKKNNDSGPRPMIPSRDLGVVLELMGEGFSEWQSWRGKTAFSALKILRHAPPLLWLLERLSSGFHEFCSGIVWLEQGQVVGIVAGHPIGADPRYWIFKNLEVRKTHRRRGVARDLVFSLIDKAVAEGAKKAIGMIRTNNAASLNLVLSFGFRELAGTSEKRLAAVDSAAPTDVPGISLRRRKPAEWHKVFELTQAVTPASLQAFEPIQEEDFDLRPRQRLGRWLTGLFSGRREHALVVEEEDELVAALTVQASRFWGEHRLEVMVHPRWRGRLEEMLISQALAILARYPKRSIGVKLFADHSEAIDVLDRFGFVEEKTQVIMGIDLETFDARSVT